MQLVTEPVGKAQVGLESVPPERGDLGLAGDAGAAAVVPRTTTSEVQRYKANATHRGKLLP